MMIYMLYFFLLLLNIIPNLYAEKNIYSFQVSTIVVNSCKNFIDDDYVSLNYDSTGIIYNSFLDNIKIKCTKNTNYNLKINDSENIVTNNITNNIVNSAQNTTEQNYQQSHEINESLIELNSKIKYLRQTAANNSKNKSFYEVVNITITF